MQNNFNHENDLDNTSINQDENININDNTSNVNNIINVENDNEILINKNEDVDADDLQIVFNDDAFDITPHEIAINENDDLADDMNLGEEITSTINADEEDYEFFRINNHRWDSGILLLTVELESGKTFDTPFSMLKKDRPLELATYIKNNVIEKKRNGKYNLWAKNILVRAQRIIRRMKRYHNISRIARIYRIKQLKFNRISRNKRNQKKGVRTKYGINIPRNVKEALAFDLINNNTLWIDAIKKEMMALETAGVWEFHPPHFRPSKDFQYAPLQMIFDVKQEDLRHKARLVSGGHVVESSMWESYSSVVQQRTIRMLETIALNEGLSFITGDIGNAFVQADTKEKIYTIAGAEFGDKKDCVVILKKALYGLATSARQWNIKLGDTIRGLGFEPTRADPDLWIKLSKDGTKYEYIATYVDDIIVVAIDPKIYLD